MRKGILTHFDDFDEELASSAPKFETDGILSSKMDLERLQIDDQHRPKRSSWLTRLTVSTIVGVVVLSAAWLLIGMFPGISQLRGLGATPVETALSRRIDPG